MTENAASPVVDTGDSVGAAVVGPVEETSRKRGCGSRICVTAQRNMICQWCQLVGWARGTSKEVEAVG